MNEQLLDEACRYERALRAIVALWAEGEWDKDISLGGEQGYPLLEAVMLAQEALSPTQR